MRWHVWVRVVGMDGGFGFVAQGDGEHTGRFRARLPSDGGMNNSAQPPLDNCGSLTSLRIQFYSTLL